MPTSSADRLDRGLVRLGLVLLAGALAALLNTTIVAVTLPELSRAFAVPVADVHWVTTAFLLAMAAAIPTMGGLVGRYGARQVWLASLAVFLAGTLLCTLAWSLPSLVAFRVVQGFGGGLILPLVQAILAQAAGPRRVGRAMAMIGVPGQLAPVLGPTLGALAVSTLGWRWAFLVTLPLTSVAWVLSSRLLPRTLPQREATMDAVGLVLAVPALVALLYGLSEATRGPAGGAGGSRVLTLGAVVAGAVLLGAFVRHAHRLGSRALLDVGLLRSGPFRASTALMFLFGFSLYGPMLVLPVYVEQVRGHGPSEVGLLLALQGVGTAAVLPVAGRWTDRFGPWLVAITGHALSAAAALALAVAGAATPFRLLVVAVLLLGAGLAAAGVAVSGTAYRVLDASAVPGATSLLNVVQRIGAAAGTAGLAAVLTHLGDADVARAVQVAFWCTVGAALVGLPFARALPCGPPTNLERS